MVMSMEKNLPTGIFAGQVMSIRIIFSVLFLFFCASLPAQNIDLRLLKSVNPDNPHSVFWKAAGNSAYLLSAGTAVGPVGYGLLYKDRKARTRGYELIISMGISAVVTQSLKIGFDRTRPADKYPGEVFVDKPVHGHSFPSGHTTIAFATATTLTLQYRRWYIALPAYLWAGAVGYSRMYAGEHYPSDVLAGAVVGAGSAFLSHWITRKIFDKRPKERLP